MSGLCERCRENAAATNDEWCSDCILEVELMLAEAEDQPREPISFRLGPIGNDGYYTMEDIQRRVAEYEDEYGLTSDALAEMHSQGMAPLDIHSFDRHVWLSMYRRLLQVHS